MYRKEVQMSYKLNENDSDRRKKILARRNTHGTISNIEKTASELYNERSKVAPAFIPKRGTPMKMSNRKAMVRRIARTWPSEEITPAVIRMAYSGLLTRKLVYGFKPT